LPTIDQHQSTKVVKLLVVGDSKSGKTGALSGLANVGYRLRIQDYDNGLDVLRHHIKSAFHPNVEYVTLTDKLKVELGRTICDGPPTAYINGVSLLNQWRYTIKDTGQVVDLGPVTSWGEDDVLVIDSLTFQGEACMRYIKTIAGTMGAPNQIQEWGEAMKKQEELLQILYGDAIKCNVIVNSHISLFSREDGTVMGYPSALGSKLPPKVPRYFNSVIQCRSWGTGAAQKRVFTTKSTSIIELGVPVPGVPLELPLETGLADLFKAITGREHPAQRAPKAPLSAPQPLT